MKKICAVFLLLVLTIAVSAKKVATLPEVISPYCFRMDDQRFYISQGATVFIYSLADYKLIKTFGKEGEGPGEILLNRSSGNDEIQLSVKEKQLVVKCNTKILFFSKDGEYIKEIRIPPHAGKWLEPYGTGYLSLKYSRNDKNVVFHAVEYYDAQFKLVKTIYKHQHGFQMRLKRPFNPLTVDQAEYRLCGQHIFIIDGARTQIQIYDTIRTGPASGGSPTPPLITIKNNDELVPFTSEDKKRITDDYKHSSFWKGMYEHYKPLFEFPDNWPPIRWFLPDCKGERLYLSTYKEKGEKRKYIAYEFSGKKTATVWLPRQGAKAIHNGKLYRVVENDETESVEFHIDDITAK
ncbi:MAG: hypothetical protein GY765_13355 [bacterium]|nr:hypothetical protein [bacterium]